MVAGGGVSHRAGPLRRDPREGEPRGPRRRRGGGRAARRGRRAARRDWVEVEIERPDQLDEVLDAGVDRVLLDNMSPDELRECVRQAAAGRHWRHRAGCRSTPCGRSPRRAWTSSASARSPTAPRRWTCRCCSSRCRRGRGATLCKALAGPPRGPHFDTRPKVRNMPAPLALENIPALKGEVRALAEERDAVILAHNYQVPEIQDVAALRGRLAGPLAPGRGRRRRRDRLLRRALHGRDGVDPLSRQDRAAARPRRGLLAGRLHHRRRAARLEGPAPRRRGGHVREHHRRGQGRDRLLLHVLQRGAGGGAHLARARRRHRDPVRPGHVPRRLRGEGHRAADERLDRRVPRARRHPARATSPTCAKPTRAPTS